MNEFLSDPLAIAVGLLGLLGACLGVLMTILAWLGRRQIARIDEVEKKQVPRDTIEKTLADMRSERREMHVENRSAMELISTKMDQLRDRISPLDVLTQRVTTTEERVQELKNFKHDTCEPACRYVDYLKTEKPWERK